MLVVVLGDVVRRVAAADDHDALFCVGWEGWCAGESGGVAETVAGEGGDTGDVGGQVGFSVTKV